jgi:hypothetical protein
LREKNSLKADETNLNLLRKQRFKNYYEIVWYDKNVKEVERDAYLEELNIYLDKIKELIEKNDG